MKQSAIVSSLFALIAVVACADGNPTMTNPVLIGGASGAPSPFNPIGQSGTGGGAGVAVTPTNPPVNPPPSAGMLAPMTAGRGVGGSGMGGGGIGGAGMGGAGMGGAGMGGAGAGGGTPGMPIIPDVAGECPNFGGGSITLMGLSGIAVVAGSKPSGPTAPMVFYWHGTGSFSGEYATMASSVVAGIREEGGVLISFQGTTGGDLLSGTAIFGRGDFELTDQLAACAVQNQNVDPKRIFATGCSAGGLFSGAMAAARSNYMAAAAPNSGGWTAPVMFQNDWTPALMTIHGAPGLDVVIIDFSRSSMTADNAFKMRGGFVINCNHGGGHCGGGGLAPDIWEFFKAHPYGTKPSPWASALPSGFNSDCMIF